MTRYPEIQNFIVQDLPETKDAAEAFIASKGLSDRVKFEGQDFFKPQQRKGKYVFVMQRGMCLDGLRWIQPLIISQVLHDWSTEDGAKMLTQIKDVLNEDVGAQKVASPRFPILTRSTNQSTLLIIDTVIQPALTSTTGRSLSDSLSQSSKTVYQPITPPPFVPTDFGDASRIQHQVNVALTALCNGECRLRSRKSLTVVDAQCTSFRAHPA